MVKTAKAGDNMNELKWKLAKRDQLYEIAYNDPGASPMHRQLAKTEIQRRERKQKRYTRVQYKIKQKFK